MSEQKEKVTKLIKTLEKVLSQHSFWSSNQTELTQKEAIKTLLPDEIKPDQQEFVINQLYRFADLYKRRQEGMDKPQYEIVSTAIIQETTKYLSPAVERPVVDTAKIIVRNTKYGAKNSLAQILEENKPKNSDINAGKSTKFRDLVDDNSSGKNTTQTSRSNTPL